MRWLTNGLRYLHGLALPTSPALTRARQRLGAKPLEPLFDVVRLIQAFQPAGGGFGFCSGRSSETTSLPRRR
jgi:Insertion element 4 transposase N-terminal